MNIRTRTFSFNERRVFELVKGQKGSDRSRGLLFVMDASKKKELRNTYKQTIQKMGVYQIRNLTSERVFVDSTLNLDGTLNRHKFELNAGSHRNRELQADWNSTSKDNFSFEVLEELPPRDDIDYNYREDLECLEDLWLEKLEPFGERGYNEIKKTTEERLQMIAANRRR